MANNIQSLQSDYLLEMGRAELDFDSNGRYTKEGVQHLLNAAKKQMEMAGEVDPYEGKRHENLAKDLIEKAYGQMKKMGLYQEEPNPQPQEPAKKEEPMQQKEETEEIDGIEELNALVGMKEAKATLRGIINANRLKHLRQNKELGFRSEIAAALNLVFTGNAGTGKTTAARIVAKIYKQYHILSKGHLVEVSGPDLIGEYVGHTGLKTTKVLESAMGGVLFIDEAYALSDNKFGETEAIPALIRAMENSRGDLAVIVAGYSGVMENFIKANQGLNSRFDHYVHFEDYTADELMQIFESMAEKVEVVLTPEAKERLKAYFVEAVKDENFGNARGARKMLDRVNMEAANRIIASVDEGQQATHEFLATIIREDVERACQHASGI